MDETLKTTYTRILFEAAPQNEGWLAVNRETKEEMFHVQKIDGEYKMGWVCGAAMFDMRDLVEIARFLWDLNGSPNYTFDVGEVFYA